MTDLSSLGAKAAGVWSRRQALVLLTRDRIQALLDDGSWQVVYPGVYADGGYVLSPVQRGFAAVIASGGPSVPFPTAEEPNRIRRVAVACGRTAARIWDFPLIDDDDPSTGAAQHVIDDVHLWRRTRRGRQTGTGGLQLVRHSLTFLDGDVVLHRSGLWCTSPLRTALDCAGMLTLEAAVCVLDDALHREAFSIAELETALRRRTGWPGVDRQRHAVQLADGRSESPAETLARLLLLPHLPGLEPQVCVRNRAGRTVARVDLGDETLKLAVETDGRRAHAGKQMVAKDRRRDRRTEAEGWWTERVTWHELRREQEAVLARVLERARARGL
jgi:hypothetical protein